MSTFVQLNYHFVFGTKGRVPFLSGEWLNEFHDYVGGVVNGLGGQSLGVGGVGDHVHLLVGLGATVRISDFMRELKKASGKWVREVKRVPNFRWGDGYGAFSVSPSAVESVRGYIGRQEEHHRVKSFEEEFRGLLERAGVEYEERYLFE